MPASCNRASFASEIARRSYEPMSDVTITIRLATAADAPRLAALRYEFRAALDPVNEDEAAFVARCCEWMQARLQQPCGWHCWVVEQSQAIIGQLWLQLIEKIPNPIAEPEFHAYISNVYVQPAARNQGLGARLLQTAVAWSRTHAVETVLLWPTAQSRSLYARHGFGVREEVLALPLTAETM